MPNVLFNSPPPVTTKLVRKTKAAKAAAPPKAKKPKVAVSNTVVDLTGEDQP